MSIQPPFMVSYSITTKCNLKCKNCYIDVKYPSKACDPWAVYSTTRSRERLGLKGAQGLNELQAQR